MSRYAPGTVRPRVHCPSCDRSIAVTRDGRSGAWFIRSHVSEPRKPCAASRRKLPSNTSIHYGRKT